jgi:photosystem II stability/assembly factor-like uncharacterized protein
MKRRNSVWQGVWVVCLLLPPALASGVPIDSNTFGGLRARAIGPATMSGRVAAVDAIPEDPLTIYVGAASGGVWKSENGGITFEAVFDDHPQAIGALTIDPSNSETVWVGTGETWTRNSVSVGRGVYRTTDGGENWELMGLEDGERVGKIIVHPSESDTVWVCVTGHLWDANEERGVFKTTDGGKTWSKILYVDADTGCADMDIDPQDPRILYAAMWEFRRSPDFFRSGGDGSALYRSTDGGDTWKKLGNGLPEGELGRIAVAVAPSRANRVYASVEAETTALYRSDDLGESWEKTSTAPVVQGRPFYFSEMAVDPEDFDRVYKCGFFLGVSRDGGESFGMLGGSTHPDHHALWINPTNPQQLLVGTDGGIYISENQGRDWRFVGTLPISQFYRVSFDLDWPYNVYGGLQDNGSWTGPSRSPGGIQNRDWQNIGYGDGFWAFADPRDPDIVYVEYQGGNLFRLDRRIGETKSIEPYADADRPKLRFNWNSPIHLSPTDPNTMYFGSQYLHRSRDRGESWEVISPDLTTDNPDWQRQEESGGLTLDNSTAENHTTLYAISESPASGEVIWVGTDDGNLQVTRDAGASWADVTGNVPGLPANTWVSSVFASPFDAATAFVTFDGHRRGDKTPYVFETNDHGATWRSLVTDQVDGYAHVVVQDPVNADLLYVGTEFGLFISVDRGEQWARFKENLPPVGVRAVAVHPTEHDLIVGTHGRGIYIIDDITPLRALTAEILNSKVALLPSRPAPMVISSSVQEFNADDQYVAGNPPEAAWISYYQRKRHFLGDLKIEVYDAEGELITTLPGRKRPGMNRVAWPMRLKPPKVPPASSLVPAFSGPRVIEGTYTVRLIKGKETMESTIELVPDPRSPHSAEDRRLQQTTALELYDTLGDMTYLIDSLNDLREQATGRAEELEGKGKLPDQLDGFGESLETLRGSLVATHTGQGFTAEEKLRERLGDLYGSVNGYDGRPTESQLERKTVLEGELGKARADLEALLAAKLQPLNRALGRKDLEPIEPMGREAWEAEKEGTAGAGVTARELHRRLPHILAGLLRAL